MRAVTLHGELAERYGAHWNLDVRSPAEAIRAIEANCPGFMAHIGQSSERGVGYRVLLDERTLSVEDVAAPFGQEHLHIVPVVVGAGNKGLVGIIIGAALIYASGGALLGAGGALAELGATAVVGSMTVSSIAGNIGLSLVLGGLSQMLVGTPKKPDTAAQDGVVRSSYNFNGPSNNVAQGGAVPVGYGRLIVGSRRISAGVSVEDITE